MSLKQKKAICKRCGKEIWIVECTDNNKWMSCDLELRKFVPGGGPGTFVGEDGKLYRGTGGVIDEGSAMWGYRKHRRDCAGGDRK